MTDEKKLFAKLASNNPFKCNYAYIDKIDEAGKIMQQNGITGKLLHKLEKRNGGELAILVVQFKKSKEAQFIKAMKDHKRNSILFGWGNTKECDEMIDDMIAATNC